MWLSQLLIPWDIRKFFVLGCQSTDHSSFAVPQDQEKQWHWCQHWKLYPNSRWSSSTFHHRPTQDSSWSNSNTTANTTKLSVELCWDLNSQANGLLCFAMRSTCLMLTNMQLWLSSPFWGSWLSNMDFGGRLIGSGFRLKEFSLWGLAILPLILVGNLSIQDFWDIVLWF